MRRILLGSSIATFICMSTPLSALAQDCPVDPGTGNAVAQMISPTNGSTLQPNPDGSITFTWCNANADYFVIIESVPGAHDIFFAFTGGAGGGAGQNFLTLGPGCAATPPTGCIPPNGETIGFTLDTVRQHQILGSFQYTFVAPSAPLGPPPVADGKLAGTAALFSRSGSTPGQIDVTYGVTPCSDTKASILYGNMGDFSAYQGCAQANAGNAGSATIDGTTLGSVWFNIVWTNGSTGGHPGFGASGTVDVERTWSAAGFCGVTADNHSDTTCN